MSEVQRGLLAASIPWDARRPASPNGCGTFCRPSCRSGTDIVLLPKDKYLAARAADDQKVDPHQDPEALKANLDYNYWSPRLAAWLEGSVSAHRACTQELQLVEIGNAHATLMTIKKHGGLTSKRSTAILRRDLLLLTMFGDGGISFPAFVLAILSNIALQSAV